MTRNTCQNHFIKSPTTLMDACLIIMVWDVTWGTSGAWDSIINGKLCMHPESLAFLLSASFFPLPHIMQMNIIPLEDQKNWDALRHKKQMLSPFTIGENHGSIVNLFKNYIDLLGSYQMRKIGTFAFKELHSLSKIYFYGFISEYLFYQGNINFLNKNS